MDILATRQSFQRRQISLRFDITNPDGSTDELLIKGQYYIIANIQNGGGMSGSIASVQVKGLNQNAINRLSIIAGHTSLENSSMLDQTNTIMTIEAGIYGQNLSHVYSGYIYNAYAQYQGNGDVTFNILARASNGLNTDINFFSIKGTVSVIDILKRLQEESATPIINHGGWAKNQSITNPTFTGTLENMIEAFCKTTGAIYHYLNLGGEAYGSTQSGHMLHIWGPLFTQNQTTNERPLISRETGLLSYPKFNASGIILDMIFNPNITYYGGVVVKSDYIPVGWQLNAKGNNIAGQNLAYSNSWDGLWLVNNVYHSLTSEVPNGEWKTTIECQRTDNAMIDLNS